MNRFYLSIVVLIFVGTTAFAEWFWWQPRSRSLWFVMALILIPDFFGWWFLLRRLNYSLTSATVIFDVAATSTWFLMLILWPEDGVTGLQIIGLVFVMIGTVLVALT